MKAKKEFLVIMVLLTIGVNPAWGSATTAPAGGSPSASGELAMTPVPIDPTIFEQAPFFLSHYEASQLALRVESRRRMSACQRRRLDEAYGLKSEALDAQSTIRARGTALRAVGTKVYTHTDIECTGGAPIWPCSGYSCGPQPIADDTDCSCFNHNSDCCSKIDKQGYYYQRYSTKDFNESAWDCTCGHYVGVIWVGCGGNNCGENLRRYYRAVQYTHKVCAYAVDFTTNYNAPYLYNTDHTCNACCNSVGGPCDSDDSCRGEESCTACTVDLNQHVTITVDHLVLCTVHAAPCQCPS